MFTMAIPGSEAQFYRRLLFIGISTLLVLFRPGIQAQTWVNKLSTADVAWNSVTYGNGKYVAVARQTNQIMYSTDGNIWNATTHPCLTNVDWNDVTFGNGIFVAVSSNPPPGPNSAVMYSSDGITWNCSSMANRAAFNSVTYGNGLFVATSTGGYNGAFPYDGGVMTSPDGITWTSRNAALPGSWRGLTFANNLFVAVSNTLSGTQVMTSPDGITWTSRSTPVFNQWYSVTYGNGLYVAVSIDGTGNRVMTSPDGINWTIRSSAADNQWYDVTFGAGLFVAVSQSGTGNRAMSSTDGINWTTESTPNNNWRAVAFGNNQFVGVGNSGTGDRAMLRTGSLPLTLVSFRAAEKDEKIFLTWVTSWEENTSHFDVERSTNGMSFTKVATVQASGNSVRTLSYEFRDNTPPQGTLYYRLRQVDTDGKFSYSLTVRTRISGHLEAVSIGPNPTSGESTLLLPASWMGSYNCRIISASGTEVYRKNGLRAGSHKIDLSRWSPGMYRVTLWENGESVYQQWIMRR